MNKTINEVTAATGTERNFKKEVFEKTMSIENALVKLEKADTLLSHWTQEYGFNEKPDPRAAIEWGRSLKDDPGRSALGSFSAKWYWEYNSIFDFVNMAFDYIIESQKILNEAMNQEGRE